PSSSFCFTSSTVVSLIRDFASLTISKKRGACCIMPPARRVPSGDSGLPHFLTTGSKDQLGRSDCHGHPAPGGRGLMLCQGGRWGPAAAPESSLRRPGPAWPRPFCQTTTAPIPPSDWLDEVLAWRTSKDCSLEQKNGCATSALPRERW